MCFDRERLESKMKPRLRAEKTGLRMVSEEMVSVGFEILESCAGRPIKVGRRNPKNGPTISYHW